MKYSVSLKPFSKSAIDEIFTDFWFPKNSGSTSNFFSHPTLDLLETAQPLFGDTNFKSLFEPLTTHLAKSSPKPRLVNNCNSPFYIPFLTFL